MAILIIIVAYYCVRNTTQDLIYAITGRVPPSFIREQNRIARREARRPVTDNRGHQQFFRNAYNDAWEEAEERRARWAAKRAQKRHKKWSGEDGVPAPIETNARPEDPIAAPAVDVPDITSEPVKPPAADTPKPVVHDDDTLVLGGKREILYQRYAMRRRNGGHPMTAVAVADELGATVVEAEQLQADWAVRYEQETNPDTPPKYLLEYQRRGSCRDCKGAIMLNKDPERPGQWIVLANHIDENCPQNTQHPTLREQHGQQAQQLADQATQNTAEGTRPGGSTTPTEENDNVTVNIETTGLQSGLAYNDAMAKTCEDGAASVEQSIAALENGEVGQSVTGPMQQGRELLESAMACFQQAHDELQAHITIKDAYDANPDAGNKTFVTAE